MLFLYVMLAVLAVAAAPIVLVLLLAAREWFAGESISVRQLLAEERL